MRRIVVSMATISLVLVAYVSAGTSPFASMYGTRKLEQEKPRYEQRMGELRRILLSLLSAQERRGLESVRIEVPLIGSQGTPIDFYTAGTVGNAAVFMPVLSLLFLEDLATAYAWLQLHNYSVETVEEYATMLRYKKAADFPGGRYSPPLKALQIPSDAMANERVSRLALSLRNEAYAFILLHELGHVLYRHRGYDGIAREQTRQHEAEADRFALTVLERGETIPMGMILWFMTQVHAMPSKGQFMAQGLIKSEADWQRYLKTEITHPLTVDRLSAIALYLDGWARRAGPGHQRDVLAFIAGQLAYMAKDLDDPDLQGCMAVVAHRADPASLAPRRINNAIGGALMLQHCRKQP
jgi:hypothetical protein